MHAHPQGICIQHGLRLGKHMHKNHFGHCGQLAQILTVVLHTQYQHVYTSVSHTCVYEP